MTVTDPHLRTLLADAGQVAAEAEALTSDLTEEQLTWQPDPNSWSVAGCLEHLRKTNKAYGRYLADTIGAAPAGNGAPFRARGLGALYVRTVGPGSRLRIPAPPVARPAMDRLAGHGRETVDRFLAQHRELEELIRRADGRDLNRARVRSPLAPLITFSLGEALTGLVLHEQRHLQQARRVTERPEFPG